MLRLRILMIAAVLAPNGVAANKEAAKLFKQGEKAEKAGDIVRAYLLYSDAAAADPNNAVYWGRSESLRTRAALKAKVRPPAITAKASSPAVSHPDLPPVPTSLSMQDLEDIQRMKPPPELKGAPGRKTLNLRGDAKAVWEQAARAFGLDTVFDGDYQAGSVLRFQIEDADCDQALHQMETVTGSFLVPLSERLFMVAKDTPQKRAEVEPTVAVTIPIPNTVTVQEAQEVARTVQQTMEILKFAVDGGRHLVFLKDRVSKVEPARKLFEDLARSRAQVMIELQMIELDRSSFMSYGFLLPTEFPIVYLGSVLHSMPQVASNFARLVVFGGGQSLLGVGIANAQLFANMNRATSRVLMDAQVRSLDGAAATFHVGDKFPITTGAFLGSFAGYAPPSFQFEDLGLSMKVTPHVHGLEEVSLDLEVEFKVLGGESVNGIPVISNRKLQSKVRLRNGEWAMVAGLMTVSEAKNISGLAGLSSLPVLGRLLRQNTDTRSSTDVVLLLKPKLLSPPPSYAGTSTVYIGTETRLRTPL